MDVFAGQALLDFPVGGFPEDDGIADFLFQFLGIATGSPGVELVVSGEDVFQFDAVSDGVDTIKDFEGIQGDRLHLSATGFGSDLAVGVLSESQFTLGSEAQRESDRLIYNNATGQLFFDADSGAP